MTKQTAKSHTKKAMKNIEHQEKSLSLHIKLQGKTRMHFMLLKSLLGLNCNELITQLIEYGIEKHREELMECLK